MYFITCISPAFKKRISVEVQRNSFCRKMVAVKKVQYSQYYETHEIQILKLNTFKFVLKQNSESEKIGMGGDGLFLVVLSIALHCGWK